MVAHGNQMSLEIQEFEGQDDLSMVGSVAVTGAMHVSRDLAKGEPLRITLTGQDGEIVAEAVGAVRVIAFKQIVTKEELRYTERAHRVKVL